MKILFPTDTTEQIQASAAEAMGESDASRAQSPVTEAIFWLEGKRRFEPCPPTPADSSEGCVISPDLDEQEHVAREPSEWGPWSSDGALAALDAGAQKLGAPQGWGWAWGAKAILDVVSDAIYLKVAAKVMPLWPELVWALGTERDLGARVRQARLLGKKNAPFRWSTESWGYHEGSKSNERSVYENALGDDFLIGEWALKGGPELERGWSAGECGAMLSVWIAAGGTLSRARTPEHPEPDSKNRENRYSLIALSLSRYGCSPDKTMALLDAGASIEEEAQGCASVTAPWAVQEAGCFPVVQRLMKMGLNFGQAQGARDPLLESFFGDPRTLLMVAEKRSGKKGAAALNWAWKRQKEAEATNEKPLGPKQIERFAAQRASVEAEELGTALARAKNTSSSSGKTNRL